MGNPYLENSIFKVVKWSLLGLLFTYILLRAIYLDPLHDEIATYIFYFYQGDFWGETIQWDANNHLLNSVLGYGLYRLFGDNFAILRMPNVIAFVFYFFATVRLVKHLNVPYLRIIGLTALNTVPFMMEYFGNARGYGLSLMFFAWALVYLLDHLRAYSVMSLFSVYACLWLAIASNLTMLLTSLMITFLLIMYPLLNNTVQLRGSKWKEWLLHFIFIGSIIPFVLFGFALKEGGALYYGSLEGIWDVTGKSLSKYVLFYDMDWLRFAFLVVFVIILALVVILLKRYRFKEWILQPVVVYAGLFFGNILAILLMAFLLEVNYPEDRTGMYLIPLFILICLWLIEMYPKGRFFQVVLLYFPYTLITHLSLETSVFSPDDRLNNEFYSAVKKEITPESTIMIYHILNWTWPYKESHASVKASVAQFDNPNSTLVDILVTKTTELENPEVIKLYDTIAYHPPSTHIAFKRKHPLSKTKLAETEIVNGQGNLEFVEIGRIDGSPYASKDIQITVKGHLKTVAPYNKIQLVIQSIGENGASERYLYYSFETTYQGELIDDDFLHHFILENVRPEEKEIKVYLWNRALHLITVTDANCQIYEINSIVDESR